MTLKMTACGLEVRRVRHQAVTTIILTLTIITRLITMAVITNLARALCLTEFIEEKGREMLMYLEQDHHLKPGLPSLPVNAEHDQQVGAEDVTASPHHHQHLAQSIASVPLDTRGFKLIRATKGI